MINKSPAQVGLEPTASPLLVECITSQVTESTDFPVAILPDNIPIYERRCRDHARLMQVHTVAFFRGKSLPRDQCGHSNKND